MNMQTTKKKKIKIKKPKDEVAILKASLARSLADYDNLRKRTERHQETIIETLTSRIVGRILPSLDALQGAEKNLQDAGLTIAVKQLVDTFNELGVSEIEVKIGDSFSDEFHEAIDIIEGSDEDPNTIAQIVQSGWEHENGKILRHTKVKVYK